MRRRSGAFHADTQEAYIKLAIECQDKDNIFYYSPKELQKSHKPRNCPRKSIEKQCFSDVLSPINSPLDEFDDFDFSRVEANPNLLLEGTELERELGPQTKNSPSAMAIECVDTSAISDELTTESNPKDRTINCMLIGAPNIGKHALINSLFPEERGSDSAPLMQALDLVIRKRKIGCTTVTYKFWFKEILNDSYETLIKLYYRQCSKFIFVYDLTSRRSFEMIIEEIKKVQEELGKQNHDAFLVATYSDKEDQREVLYEEGVDIKMKFALQHFSETNQFIERDTQQLLKRIDSN